MWGTRKPLTDNFKGQFLAIFSCQILYVNSPSPPLFLLYDVSGARVLQDCYKHVLPITLNLPCAWGLDYCEDGRHLSGGMHATLAALVIYECIA